MGILKGKNLLLSVGLTENGKFVYKTYGFATSCELNITVDTTETSSTNFKQMAASGDGSWKEFTVSKKSWTASTDHLVGVISNFDSVFQTLVADNPEVMIKFGVVSYKSTDADGDDNLDESFQLGGYYYGKAIINSLSVSAPEEGEATFSVQMQGTGALKLISTEADEKKVDAGSAIS
jgi:predicted secreted protein